jgi:peptidoglycan/xylan/chitin deacetylase (PgdA/CDA1 family)
LPQWLTRILLELLYFTGVAGFAKWRGLGIILKFERVRTSPSTGFRPLRGREITPQFLNQLLLALRRWNYEIISIDQLRERLLDPPGRPRRFVCLTFDIGYRDFLERAWPILKRHGVPVTLYLPASFPDHLGELWWLALREVIAKQERIGFVIDGVDSREDCGTLREKQLLFDFLYAKLRAMTPANRSAAIRDLCARYGVDLDAVSAAATLSWTDIAKIADDPLLTIGSATASYATLSSLDRQASEREIKMGRAVVEAAIGRRAPHLAFPFGTSDTFAGRELITAFENGFLTAVTTEPAIVEAKHREHLLALPRLSWDGRCSMRAMRVVLAGLMLNGAARRD